MDAIDDPSRFWATERLLHLLRNLLIEIGIGLLLLFFKNIFIFYFLLFT